MRIDGTHLNHILFQNRGEGVRPSEVAQSLNVPRALGAVPRMADAESGQSLSQTFANEIARRAKAYTDSDGKPKDTSALAAGLADAVEYLRSNYGDDIATAAEAMIMGGTAGGITEKNLGNSLTNVLGMVDRNFGFAAGDATIAKFNGQLNDSINNFFDNGLNERFLATEPGQGLTLSAVKNDLNSRVLAGTRAVADSDGGMEELLKSLKDDLDKTLEEILDENLEELTPENISPEQLSARTSKALNGYAAASGIYADAGPQMLSMSV